MSRRQLRCFRETGGGIEQIAGLINTPFQNPAKSQIMQEARELEGADGASFLFSLGEFLITSFPTAFIKNLKFHPGNTASPKTARRLLLYSRYLSRAVGDAYKK